MNIPNFINEWLAASNAFDTQKYLEFYNDDVILDDPSVGKQFKGHEGIKEYFDNYFIGYNTDTQLVNLNVKGIESAHLEVNFTGTFAEGTIGGIFDFKFKNEKIIFVKADLIH